MLTEALAGLPGNGAGAPLGQATGQTVAWVLLVLAAITGVAALVALAIVYRALRELGRAADELAEGNLHQRVGVEGPLQLRGLGERLNQVAGQLQERLATVVQQRNELGAVLSSMVEGVVAVDVDDRIMSLNRAAAELLELSPEWAIGRPVQEAIRNRAIQNFVGRTLHENANLQEEVTVRSGSMRQPDERHFQAQSAILRDAGGERLGAVIVLHDVTRLRRLELVRRDFVANVSHEIKTPVSAIRAAVETLRDEPGAEAEQTEQILSIIDRQSHRLGAIVDDLLSLARIEQNEDSIFEQLAAEPVRPVLEAAVETCQAKADEKQVTVEVDCEQTLRGWMNRPLLEQAVVNLVDNAVKYSPDRTTVRAQGRLEEAEVVVSVIDQGRGIEPAHLPRVFERFYRTDKARSRAMGGTGLGLSIVKHVAEAQGGRVSVDSSPGYGSAFHIFLRAAERKSAPETERVKAPRKAAADQQK
jgi:two-component system phosphate regulon sensor histidine kinase PhoR